MEIVIFIKLQGSIFEFGKLRSLKRPRLWLVQWFCIVHSFRLFKKYSRIKLYYSLWTNMQPQVRTLPVAKYTPNTDTSVGASSLKGLTFTALGFSYHLVLVFKFYSIKKSNIHKNPSRALASPWNADLGVNCIYSNLTTFTLPSPSGHRILQK